MESEELRLSVVLVIGNSETLKGHQRLWVQLQRSIPFTVIIVNFIASNVWGGRAAAAGQFLGGQASVQRGSVASI
jgi:hypothetical protein